MEIFIDTEYDGCEVMEEDPYAWLDSESEYSPDDGEWKRDDALC
jgi:hypothetical protein